MMRPGTYVVEHKSTSLDIGLGSVYWKRLNLDGQISTYMVGARALGHEPSGVLYDVVRKVRLKPFEATPVENRKYTQESSRACKECKKKSPTPGPHIEEVKNDDGSTREVACVDGRIVTDPGGRLHANMRERDETPDEYRARVRADIGSDPDKYYQRGLIVRSSQEEVDAAADAWAIAEQIRESRRRGRWRRNVDACDSYGQFCAYWPVCSGEASIDDSTRYRDSKEHDELASPSDDAKKHLPILSVSSARAYGACPKKYFFAYELRRRSIEDGFALRFGTVFHIGLEVWWTTVDIVAALAAMRAAYAKHKIELIDAIRAEELMLGYHVRWKDEPLDVLAVEAEFRTALINPETDAASKTWQRGGKIDAIVRIPEPASVAA